MDIGKYLDKLNLPGTYQDDGSLDMGDSAAIFFNLAALDSVDLKKLKYYFDDVRQVPRRHPNQKEWWGQPDRYSRDQLIPLLCWAALKDQGDLAFVKKIFISHLKRMLLLAWNSKGNSKLDIPSKIPDVTFLEIWSLWLRIFKPTGYKLILWIFDIETLVGSISWKFRKDRVCRNHMLVNITQNQISPTFISKLSYKINNWSDLVKRWSDHCDAVGEYPTAQLFKDRLIK